MEDVYIYLKRLGLQEYEAKILGYLSSKCSKKTAKEISEGTNIPYTKIYTVLSFLLEKHFLDCEPGKPQKFGSKSIEFIFNILLDKKEKEIVHLKDQKSKILSNIFIQDTNLKTFWMNERSLFFIPSPNSVSTLFNRSNF
jgi:sugar-specific transcriptional regulator TrmB